MTSGNLADIFMKLTWDLDLGGITETFYHSGTHKQIAAAFAKCREFFDSVPDLVLNCAAAVGEQDWERMYDVNIVSFHSI